MNYRYAATTLEGFVQQVAVGYVARGYVFYVSGWVPENKEPTGVDEKLLGKYEIAISKWQRARRKRLGLANMQYIRLERRFVLLATQGNHEFFAREKVQIRDFRRHALQAGGYSVSLRRGHDRRWHPHVRIGEEEWGYLRSYVLEHAVHRKRESLERIFWTVPFEPYAGVRRQLFTLLRQVNRGRKRAGYEPVSRACIRMKRKCVKPFEPVASVHEHDGNVVVPGSERWGKRASSHEFAPERRDWLKANKPGPAKKTRKAAG